MRNPRATREVASVAWQGTFDDGLQNEQRVDPYHNCFSAEYHGGIP